MTQTPRIVYRANEDATREVEISALASVYAFVLSCKEKAGGSDAGENDARKVKDACTAKEKYTRTSSSTRRPALAELPARAGR